jgi:hypothetical protein
VANTGDVHAAFARRHERHALYWQSVTPDTKRGILFEMSKLPGQQVATRTFWPFNNMRDELHAEDFTGKFFQRARHFAAAAPAPGRLHEFGFDDPLLLKVVQLDRFPYQVKAGMPRGAHQIAQDIPFWNREFYKNPSTIQKKVGFGPWVASGRAEAVRHAVGSFAFLDCPATALDPCIMWRRANQPCLPLLLAGHRQLQPVIDPKVSPGVVSTTPVSSACPEAFMPKVLLTSTAPPVCRFRRAAAMPQIELVSIVRARRRGQARS